ncbi:MAG TPA: substrate-binding domain-containing protein [Methylomirabilota bacterium]|nr:substrate-binding domain-containing protein [Methylomirabilota bacterium]
MLKRARPMLASLVMFGFSGTVWHPVGAAEPRPPGQAEWEKTVKAAEQEGALVIYMTQAFEPVFRDVFQKKFPKIRVTTATGRGPELSQRVMSERRAEKFAVDLYISGNISPLTVFHRAKILEPVKPLLVLPEVIDPSAWYEGKHHYDDPEGRYIFVFEGTPRSGEITFNTKLVNPAEIKSYWDLLNPKWKGKIVSVDPMISGPISAAEIFFYKHPELGPEFIRRLFAETDITVVRSNEQMLDWLSAGKYAFGIGARDVDTAMMQGLPLGQFLPGWLKEGSSVTAYNGTLSFFNRAPHPNAAKLAVNWLLSREGQATWLDFNQKSGGLYDSLREDISKEKVNPRARRIKGAKFLWLDPAWVDELDSIRELIKKALAGAGKTK